MVSVVFTPRWFHGVDCVFECVAVLVALLIAFYSYKLYTYTKTSSHKYFSVSFLAIALAFISKIVTNLSLLPSTVGVLPSESVGAFFYGHHRMVLEHFLYVGGFFSYRLLMLLGLLGVYFVIHRYQAKKMVMFGAYMITMLTLATTFSIWAYPIFYVTAALLLLFIAQFYYDVYYGKRGHKKNANVKALLAAFAVIMLAQVTFMLVIAHLYFYVAAEALQLVGFLMLLYVYYKLVIKKK